MLPSVGFNVVRATRTIPGLLWTPEGSQPAKALVLLGHGGKGDKRQGYIVVLARRLVRHHGFAAAAIDGPVHGERRRDTTTDGDDIEMEFAQVWRNDPTVTDEIVADWRAVLDELQAPAVLGPTPVGYWGLSMGTILGLPVVAAEPESPLPCSASRASSEPPSNDSLDDAASIHCPVLFLAQWDDELFRRDKVFELFGAIGSSDKRLHVTPAGIKKCPPKSSAPASGSWPAPSPLLLGDDLG